MTDADIFGKEGYQQAIDYLLEVGHLVQVRGGGDDNNGGMGSTYRIQAWIGNPQKDVNLRMIDPITFEVVDESRENVVIDHVGYSRAFYELYEGVRLGMDGYGCGWNYG